jgi:hypothetical protein
MSEKPGTRRNSRESCIRTVPSTGIRANLGADVRHTTRHVWVTSTTIRHTTAGTASTCRPANAHMLQHLLHRCSRCQPHVPHSYGRVHNVHTCWATADMPKQQPQHPQRSGCPKPPCNPEPAPLFGLLLVTCCLGYSTTTCSAHVQAHPDPLAPQHSCQQPPAAGAWAVAVAAGPLHALESHLATPAVTFAAAAAPASTV